MRNSPVAQRKHNMFVASGTLYLVGHTNTGVFEYDPVGDSWSQLVAASINCCV